MASDKNANHTYFVLSYKLNLSSSKTAPQILLRLAGRYFLNLLQASWNVAIFISWRSNTYIQQITLDESFKFFDSLWGLKHLYTHQLSSL